MRAVNAFARRVALSLNSASSSGHSTRISSSCRSVSYTFGFANR